MNKQAQVGSMLAVRPSEMSEEQSIMQNPHFVEFLEMISQGCSIRHACSLSGLTANRVYAQLAEDNALHKPALRRLVERAKAVYYKKQIDKLNKTHDWKAAAFWLERHEEEFKLQRESGTLVQVGVNVNTKPEISLSPEDLQRLSEAYDREKQHTSQATQEPLREGIVKDP